MSKSRVGGDGAPIQLPEGDDKPKQVHDPEAFRKKMVEKSSEAEERKKKKKHKSEAEEDDDVPVQKEITPPSSNRFAELMGVKKKEGVFDPSKAKGHTTGSLEGDKGPAEGFEKMRSRKGTEASEDVVLNIDEEQPLGVTGAFLSEDEPMVGEANAPSKTLGAGAPEPIEDAPEPIAPEDEAPMASEEESNPPSPEEETPPPMQNAPAQPLPQQPQNLTPTSSSFDEESGDFAGMEEEEGTSAQEVSKVGERPVVKAPEKSGPEKKLHEEEKPHKVMHEAHHEVKLGPDGKPLMLGEEPKPLKAEVKEPHFEKMPHEEPLTTVDGKRAKTKSEKGHEIHTQVFAEKGAKKTVEGAKQPLIKEGVKEKEGAKVPIEAGAHEKGQREQQAQVAGEVAWTQTAHKKMSPLKHHDEKDDYKVFGISVEKKEQKESGDEGRGSGGDDQQREQEQQQVIEQVPGQAQPVGAIAPIENVQAPQGTQMHPQVFALFETMVKQITVEKLKGVTKTTVEVHMPGSVFQGAQITIERFASAQNTFHIQILANPEALTLLDKNLPQLENSLQAIKGDYQYNLQRPVLLAEHQTVGRKREGEGGDSKGQQQQEQRDKRKKKE